MKKMLRILALLLAVVSFTAVAPVHAQSNGIGITPRKDYTVKPGEKVSDQLFISNLSQTQNLRVSIRVIDFKAQGETGTPALLLQKNAPNAMVSQALYFNTFYN